ncbi:MAG TPA: LLM class flavin-dependent oxidoreductase [Propionibacterium sp.]|jgi:alkanesulfonate monooxygenase SsuD/methylene tetrahydromethanopterin reductase-like flavin-dependent oxidoreductase (luciferase family)|nr:LLM class flavin-dependent oxidoreductase [Propionibacterium sp.]
MRVGVCVLTDLPWAEAEPVWQEIEDLGYHHAWTYDHLIWDPMNSEKWYSTVVTLAGVAAVTSRIPLGFWVSSPNFRHPAAFARELVGLQDLSGGRILCGVGSGGEPDAQVLGEELSRGARTRRLREFMEVLGRSLAEDHVNHDGEFYRVVDYRNVAGLDQAPPKLIVAANGPRALQLAVEHEAWATTGLGGESVDEWWENIAKLRRMADEAGGEGIDSYLYLDSAPRFSLDSAEFCLDQIGRAEELGFTDVVLTWPRGSWPYEGNPDVVREVASKLRLNGN